jgi:hypothetical protein
MPIQDIIKDKFSDADFVALNTALTTIENIVKGKTVNLSPDERKRYGSINEQHKLLVGKVDDYHTSHPKFDNPYLDWTEISNDNKARKRHEMVINRLESLVAQFVDTKILHDFDSYGYALSQYAHINYLDGQNVPGVRAVKEDIAQLFTRTGSSEAPKKNP